MSKIELTTDECLSRTYKHGICHTLGHSDLSWESFLNILKTFHIDTVVDIRSLPFSHRSPRYRRDALEEALPLSDITYIYMGDELGDLPMDQDLWLPSGHVNHDLTSSRTYFRSAIVKLSFLCRSRRLLLLCSEKEPYKCHRYSLVSPYLCATGIEVHHIVDENCIIHAQTELFRDGLPFMI